MQYLRAKLACTEGDSKTSRTIKRQIWAREGLAQGINELVIQHYLGHYEVVDLLPSVGYDLMGMYPLEHLNIFNAPRSEEPPDAKGTH